MDAVEHVHVPHQESCAQMGRKDTSFDTVDETIVVEEVI